MIVNCSISRRDGAIYILPRYYLFGAYITEIDGGQFYAKIKLQELLDINYSLGYNKNGYFVRHLEILRTVCAAG